MKPRLFIGSSKEALKIAEKVKSFFEPEFVCTIWNKGFFELNKSTLDSLLQGVILYDFAIIIWTKDDIADIRGNLFEISRDNVVFELGLFLGGLGKNKAFILCENGVKTPSDLNGITVPYFESLKNGYSTLPNTSIEESLKTIKDKMLSNSDNGYLSLLPSTTLAIAYYYNFVKRISDWININDNKPIFPKFWNKRIYQLKIIRPTKVEKDMNQYVGIFSKERALKKYQIKIRRIGRNLNVLKRQKNENYTKIDFFDMPTTLSSLHESIKLCIPQQCIGNDEEKNYLLNREANNFFRVLDHLIKEEMVTKKYSCIINENDI